jgi:hypothetical protein
LVSADALDLAVLADLHDYTLRLNELADDTEPKGHAEFDRR